MPLLPNESTSVLITTQIENAYQARSSSVWAQHKGREANRGNSPRWRGGLARKRRGRRRQHVARIVDAYRTRQPSVIGFPLSRPTSGTA